MKKFLFAVVTLFTMSLSSQALSFDWGLQAGWNLTKMSFDKDNFNGKNTSGFFVGPKINLGIIAGFGVNVAAEYNYQRLKYENETTGNTDSKVTHSIEIPINLRYSFGIGKINIYAETGPQFGFVVGNKNWNKLFTNDNMLTTWNLGAGVRFTHLELGLNYNFGLGKVGESILSNIGSGLVGTADDYKANSFQLHAAYYF